MRPCMSVVVVVVQAYQITHVNQGLSDEFGNPSHVASVKLMINYTLVVKASPFFRGVDAASNSTRSWTRGRFTSAAQRAYKSAKACAGARRPMRSRFV